MGGFGHAQSVSTYMFVDVQLEDVGPGGTDYVKVTTGVPLGRVLFEIQKALAKGMILRICPSEGSVFVGLTLSPAIFIENHHNNAIRVRVYGVP